MKNTFYLIGALLIWGATCEANQSFFIDFGTADHTTKSPEPKGRHWNNAIWGGVGDKQELKLVDASGKPSNLRVVRVNGFFGGYDAGTNPQSLYPASVGKDRWSLEKGKVESGVIRILGLAPGQIVTLRAFGTREAPVEFVTKFSAAGKHAQINCQNNSKKEAVLSNIRIGKYRRVDMAVSIASGPNGHLSALVLTIQQNEQSAPTAAPTPAKPKPKPAQPTELEKSRMADELAELGLGDEESSGVLKVAGFVCIGLGLLIIVGSVWYFLKPESP